MKQKIKSMLALILCAMFVMTGILSTGADTAYAADGKVPVKVTFKKTTVTVSKDASDNDDSLDVTLETLNKKWGKPKKPTEDMGFGYVATTYTWKKGKSSIKYIVGDGPIHSYFDVFIYDKNVEIFGVKYGMKKDAALKKLKKLAKKESDISVSTNEDNTKKESIYVMNGAANCTVELKNGKVIAIEYTSIVK